MPRIRPPRNRAGELKFLATARGSSSDQFPEGTLFVAGPCFVGALFNFIRKAR